MAPSVRIGVRIRRDLQYRKIAEHSAPKLVIDAPAPPRSATAPYSATDSKMILLAASRSFF
jgi:hypothetical protein